jgi:hypothetical protein
MNRRSNPKQKEHVVKIALTYCTLLLTLASGCTIDWGNWKGGGQNEYPKASGVNVLNCSVDNSPYEKGFAYSIYARTGEGSWQSYGDISPITSANDCGTSVAHVPFDSPGIWTVRAIQIDFGDPYGSPNQCNSSTGNAEGCAPGQYTTQMFTQDPTQPDTTMTVK